MDLCILACLYLGFPGFLKDFSMWDQALSSEQVKSLYVQGIDTSAVEPVEKAVQLLQSTRNKVLPIFSVIRNSHLASVQVDSGGANSMIEVTTADVINSLMIKAAEARGSCASYESRLDLYTEAAGLGSAEALYLWSMMIRYGSEEPITSCGIGKASTYNSENDLDQERATLGFIAAASMGYASAFVPLSISLLTGLGINSLIQFHPELLKTLQIPAHRLNESAFDFIDAIRFYIKCGEYIERGMKAKEGTVLRTSESYVSCVLTFFTIDLGGSIICQNQNRDNLAALSLGFVYVAAMAGVSEAHTILAYR